MDQLVRRALHEAGATLADVLHRHVLASGIDAEWQVQQGDGHVVLTCQNPVLVHREVGSVSRAPAPVLEPAVRCAMPVVATALAQVLESGEP